LSVLAPLGMESSAVVVTLALYQFKEFAGGAQGCPALWSTCLPPDHKFTF
jgi:hypothetical protein